MRHMLSHIFCAHSRILTKGCDSLTSSIRCLARSGGKGLAAKHVYLLLTSHCFTYSRTRLVPYFVLMPLLGHPGRVWGIAARVSLLPVATGELH